MARNKQLPNTQLGAWNRILEAVRAQLIEPALRKARVTLRDVEWTQFRWDAADITASWHKADSERNVHAWLTGDTSAYRLRLNFEGASWQDDPAKLKRRVLFFRGPEGDVIAPPWDDPIVRISDQYQLLEQTEFMVQQVQSAALDKVDWQYDMQPDPRKS